MAFGSVDSAKPGVVNPLLKIVGQPQEVLLRDEIPLRAEHLFDVGVNGRVAEGPSRLIRSKLMIAINQVLCVIAMGQAGCDGFRRRVDFRRLR